MVKPRSTRRQIISACIAAGLAAVTIVLLVNFFTQEDDATKDWVDVVWYYDMNTGTLFEGKPAQIPPIPAPSGPHASGQNAGVRAFVFGCGDCSEENRFLGYLEMYARDAHTALLKDKMSAQGDVIRLGRLICDGADPKGTWVQFQTPQAKDIWARLNQRCGGAKPVKCYPGGEMRR